MSEQRMTNDEASSITPIISTSSESEASPPLPILDLKIEDIEGNDS